MKKIYVSMLCLCMNFFQIPAYAQLPTPATSSVQQIQVGVVAAVKGKVEIVAPEQVGKIVESGEVIFIGDEIRTGEKGQLQIMLLDETVFTIGPKSAMVIDEFVYDPATANGKIDARIVEGAFRLITGKIGAKKPKNMNVKLPVGSVGIRGTIVYGKVEGNSSQLLLLGPGSNNNTQHKTGAIIVENETEDGDVETTEVNKSGFSTTIPGPGQPPTPAVQLSDAETQAMVGAISSNDSDDDEEEGSSSGSTKKDSKSKSKNQGSSSTASSKSDSGTDGDAEGEGLEIEGDAEDDAGQSTVGALGVVVDADDVGDFGDDLGDEVLGSLQDTLDDEATNVILDGLTTIDQLDDAIEDDLLAGTEKFQSSGHVLNKDGDPGNNGTFDFYIIIDFDNRKIGGSGSQLTATHGDINSSVQQTYKLDDGSGNGVVWEDASTDGEFATFAFDDIMDTTVSGCTSCLADVTIDLNNEDGNIADFAEVGVEISNSAENYSGEGSALREVII